MGGSSWPNDFDKDEFGPQETVDYLVGYLERWRIAMKLNEPFYLVGHSFGGYVVGHYAVKY